MTIAKIEVPELSIVGLTSFISVAYRMPGVDYSDRDEIDGHEGPWEGPLTYEAVLAQLHGLGLDVATHNIENVRIEPMQRLEKIKPLMVNGAIQGVQGTASFLDFSFDPKNPSAPHQILKIKHYNVRFWFNDARVVKVKDKDLKGQKSAWEASGKVGQVLLKQHGLV